MFWMIKENSSGGQHLSQGSFLSCTAAQGLSGEAQLFLSDLCHTAGAH